MNSSRSGSGRDRYNGSDDGDAKRRIAHPDLGEGISAYSAA